MSGALGATRRKPSEVRPPFVSGKRFTQDFAFVRGRQPLCCYCGRSVKLGEVVAWGRAWKPETLRNPE